MKLPSVNLSSVNVKGLAFFKKVKFRVSWGIWLFLAIILLALVWVIWGEWAKLALIKADPSNINDKIVRVNMQQHQEIEKQLETNQRYTPQEVPGTEVFASPPDNIN